MSEMKTYARLDESGNIVEYPVYDMHIRNRNHPYEWYTECTLANKPVPPRFYFVKENLEVFTKQLGSKVERFVTVNYQVLPQELNNILFSISKNAAGQPSTVSDLDQATLDKIIELVDNYVESKLDAFAKTRGYTSAERCAGYKDSTIAKFSTEAATVIAIRDQVWVKMPDYLTKVITGVKPLPRTTADIDAELPEFVW